MGEGRLVMVARMRMMMGCEIGRDCEGNGKADGGGGTSMRLCAIRLE